MFGLPAVSLIDCPGYMVVGPAAEAEALVQRGSRMLVAGAALTVPLIAATLVAAAQNSRSTGPKRFVDTW